MPLSRKILAMQFEVQFASCVHAVSSDNHSHRKRQFELKFCFGKTFDFLEAELWFIADILEPPIDTRWP